MPPTATPSPTSPPGRACVTATRSHSESTADVRAHSRWCLVRCAVTRVPQYSVIQSTSAARKPCVPTARPSPGPSPEPDNHGRFYRRQLRLSRSHVMGLRRVRPVPVGLPPLATRARSPRLCTTPEPAPQWRDDTHCPDAVCLPTARGRTARVKDCDLASVCPLPAPWTPRVGFLVVGLGSTGEGALVPCPGSRPRG